MIRIGICDDEICMQKNLGAILQRQLQLMGMDYKLFKYGSGEEMLAAPLDDFPEILFLDIEMPGIDGIGAAKAIRKKGLDTVIIFVTAYPDFVFQGYDVHAFHYILKPYDEKKIKWVTEQALRELDIREERFFLVEQKSGSLRLPLKEVIAFQSDGRKVIAFAGQETISFYGKLGDVAREVPDYFVRIHNRYLVNLSYVQAVEKEQCICHGRSFPVSRAYRQGLEVAFARMMLK